MSSFQDREKKRNKSGVVSAIAGVENDSQKINKGRPNEERETKKRISLAILPSLYEDIKKIAYVDRKSVSEVIANCLIKYVEDNQDKLNEYENIAN